MPLETQIDVVYSVWGAEDRVFSGGVQDVTIGVDVDAHILAGGVAAGAVRLVDPSDEVLAALEPHVESQEDSEAAYEAAVASGAWREGHLQQWIAETEERLALSNDEANLNDNDRKFLAEGVDKAYVELEKISPDAHDEVIDLVARQAEARTAADEAASAGEEV